MGALAWQLMVAAESRDLLGSAFLGLDLAAVSKFRKASSGEIVAVVTV